MNDDIDIAALEIGYRGKLSDAVLNEMKGAPSMAHCVHPHATIVLLIGGYDRDPRSLWDIPEAADYVRRFAVAAGLDDWRDELFSCLGHETKAMLIKCDAIRKPHPFTVIIE